MGGSVRGAETMRSIFELHDIFDRNTCCYPYSHQCFEWISQIASTSRYTETARDCYNRDTNHQGQVRGLIYGNATHAAAHVI